LKVRRSTFAGAVREELSGRSRFSSSRPAKLDGSYRCPNTRRTSRRSSWATNSLLESSKEKAIKLRGLFGPVSSCRSKARPPLRGTSGRSAASRRAQRTKPLWLSRLLRRARPAQRQNRVNSARLVVVLFWCKAGETLCLQIAEPQPTLRNQRVKAARN
jgi:hypothetical protein